MLAPLQGRYLQRTIAGLNTISSSDSPVTTNTTIPSFQSLPPPISSTKRDGVSFSFSSTSRQPHVDPAVSLVAGNQLSTLEERENVSVSASSPIATTKACHILLVHGFAGGLAHWLPNFQFLSKIAAEQHQRNNKALCVLMKQHQQRKKLGLQDEGGEEECEGKEEKEAARPLVEYYIHAIDLPGFGRSVRDSVSFKNEDQSMAYLTDKLFKWIAAMGLVTVVNTPTLSAEKSGGIGSVDGVQNLPPSFFSAPSCGSYSPTPGTELHIIAHSFGAYTCAKFACLYPNIVTKLVLADPWGVPSKPPDAEKNLPWKYKVLLKVANIGTPLSTLRLIGPWGPTLFQKARTDFAGRWAPLLGGDPSPFYHYTYHINAQSPATGEAAFQACCDGPAFAKSPMLHWLPRGLANTTTKLAVVYGEHTWMDRAAGGYLVSLCAKAQQAVCRIVSRAGHQVNTDNVVGFHAELVAALGLPKDFAAVKELFLYLP